MANPRSKPASAGFRVEMQSLPALHRVLVWLSLVCLVVISIEAAFTWPYILIRFGWGG